MLFLLLLTLVSSNGRRVSESESWDLEQAVAWKAEQAVGNKGPVKKPTEKVCEHWAGPNKNWLGMQAAMCQVEQINVPDTAACLKACQDRDDCDKVAVYEGRSMNCARIHSCNVPDTDVLFSDYDDPSTWYACNKPDEQPWAITKEPTPASEFNEKKCEEVSGLGTTIEDFRHKCAYLQILNGGPFPDTCWDACEDVEDCTHVAATQVDLQNPRDIQCFLVACTGDLEFIPRAESKVVWKECKQGELAPVTLEPTAEITATETEITTTEVIPTTNVPVVTTVTCTCDEVSKMIASGQCTEPTQTEVTMQPTTAAPTKEMLWQVEGPDRCPLAYKLGAWGHFGRTKNTKKCEKKCKSHPDCVAISWKTENKACTGFSSCPFFESTAEFGGNQGWVNVRVKPEPSASAYSASFQVEEDPWTALRAGERAFACIGLLAVVVLGMKALRSSKPDNLYLHVDQDL